MRIKHSDLYTFVQLTNKLSKPSELPTEITFISSSDGFFLPNFFDNERLVMGDFIEDSFYLQLGVRVRKMLIQTTNILPFPAPGCFLSINFD
jgi:hypothetical protein